MDTKTDGEIICEWMDPKPSKGPFDFHPWRSISPGGWWHAEANRRIECEKNVWTPRTLTLVELWDVEDRLTDEQWKRYSDLFMGRKLHFRKPLDYGDVKPLLHATAEQKIKALAEVIGAGDQL